MPNTQPDRSQSCEVNNETSTTDTFELHAQIGRLQVMLTHARRVYADLVAACRAALVANADGDADPWVFVRDELPSTPPGHPLSTPDPHRGGGER